MIAAIGKFLLAVAMGAVAIIAAICAVTGRWPSMVVVESRLPASECSFAFSDGFTWDVDLNPGQERFWLFVLGRPEKVAATCGVGSQKVERIHYFCSEAFRQNVVVSAEDRPDPCIAR